MNYKVYIIKQNIDYIKTSNIGDSKLPLELYIIAYGDIQVNPHYIKYLSYNNKFRYLLPTKFFESKEDARNYILERYDKVKKDIKYFSSIKDFNIRKGIYDYIFFSNEDDELYTLIFGNAINISFDKIVDDIMSIGILSEINKVITNFG